MLEGILDSLNFSDFKIGIECIKGKQKKCQESWCQEEFKCLGMNSY